MRFKEFITESKESREAMKRMNLKYMGYGFYRGNGNTYKWNPQLKRMEKTDKEKLIKKNTETDFGRLFNKLEEYLKNKSNLTDILNNSNYIAIINEVYPEDYTPDLKKNDILNILINDYDNKLEEYISKKLDIIKSFLYKNSISKSLILYRKIILNSIDQLKDKRNSGSHWSFSKFIEDSSYSTYSLTSYINKDKDHNIFYLKGIFSIDSIDLKNTLIQWLDPKFYSEMEIVTKDSPTKLELYDNNKKFIKNIN